MQPKEPSLENILPEKRLEDLLRTTSRYAPLLAAFTAAGLVAIYLLSSGGLLGTPAWQLLAITASCLFLAVGHLAVGRLVNTGRVFTASVFSATTTAIFAILVSFFWAGITPIAIVIAWAAPLSGLFVRARQRYFTWPALTSALSTLFILLIDLHPFVDRLQNSNPAALAGLSLIFGVVILVIFLLLASRVIHFRTLQSRLLFSFVTTITVPIVVISLLSTLNAYTVSQNQFRDSLDAISSLKQDQIDNSVQGVLTELSNLQQGTGEGSNILYILEHQGENDALYQLNASLASTRIRDFMVQQQASNYEEVLVLDPGGNVILATYKLDEGLNFNDQAFFKEGSLKNFVGLIKFPGGQNFAREYKLVATAPLFSQRTLRGMLVLVANSELVTHIMGVTPGLANVDTYLVDENFNPVAGTLSPTNTVKTEATLRVIRDNVEQGSGVYNNYAGTRVLGYYRWYKPMRVALVAEIPQSAVVGKALSNLLTSGLVGILAIVVAIVTVVFTSRAISTPIGSLARTAQQIASGQLQARAQQGDREDEIGELARSFNSMAQQLQGTVTNLEERVAIRTEDLEKQAIRLKAAAEVARDAASAQSMEELLDRSARLIHDRFNFYHVGIFLIDRDREYAVLRASPTDAGHEMIANNHRLRIGEQGIVGRVAGTGEPRIALDIGVDSVYFSNPLLPATRSEMALPLKSNETIMGVLDVQSDQAEAFTQDDIAVMQVMADQLSIAIERTRLLQQVETSLKELEHTYGEFTADAWKSFSNSRQFTSGYRFDSVRLEPITEIPGEAKAMLERGLGSTSKSTDKKSGSQTAAVPVRLRGQTIGVINIRFQGKDAPEETLAMAEQAADRLAVALETARLLMETRQRAQRDSLISELSNRVRATLDLDTVLKTAAQELQQAFQLKEVEVRLGFPKVQESGAEAQDDLRKNGKRRD